MASSALVQLAQAVVEQYVLVGAVAHSHFTLPPDLPDRAACFVSIHRRDGSLRGCVGTISPVEPDLTREIARNAIAACSRDPRFQPVLPEELASLQYSVDVLSTPEAIETPRQLDARRYGVIVERGWHRGLLLPDLPGVDSAEQQLGIALEKAGIQPGEAYRLYRFTVQRFH